MATDWAAVQLEIEEGQRIKARTGNTDHYPIRYVVTYLDKEGTRVMLGARQGRNTHATQEEAQAACNATKANNSADTLARFPALEVRPCKCYPGHFDPCDYAFDFDLEKWIEEHTA